MLQERAESILAKGYVCDHCLGRQFAQLLTGMSNRERGEVVRTWMAMRLDSGEEIKTDDANFQDFQFRNYETEDEEGEECFVCGDLFEELGGWEERVLEKTDGLEFDNFLVGTRLPDELVKNEEELWEETGIEHCEELKAEVNREMGKRLEERTDKAVEFDLPEIVILLDLKDDKIDLDVNSLCVYGEYQKKERGIPQTEWPSGKFEVSIEEIIAPAFLRAADATEEKFHGAGREDIDARCLGWRPFILEILEPRRRDVDLEEIKEEVNENEEVEISNLKFVPRDTIEKLKEWQPDKTYRAVVRFEEGVPEDLDSLEKLETTVSQRTPSRVEHRRADRTRKRKVKDISWEKVDSERIELEVKAEAGTYIKELISGDGGRTEPSVSSILRKDVECEKLDVIEIHGKENLDL